MLFTGGYHVLPVFQLIILKEHAQTLNHIMKKIILASDGKNLPKGAFEFIKQLQQTEPLLLIKEKLSLLFCLSKK